MVDNLFYAVINPLTDAIAPFGIAMMSIAFFYRWAAATFTQISKGPNITWLDAGLALIWAIILYVPVPDPGRWIGHESSIENTTVAAFVIERITTGGDQLCLLLVEDDATIQGAKRVDLNASNADLLYTFLSQRAQFCLRYGSLLFGDISRPPPAVPDDSEIIETPSFLDSIVSGEVGEYIEHQILLIFHSIGSFLTVLLAWLLMAAVSLILLLLAGLARFAPIFIMVISLIAIPIGYSIQGSKAIKAAFSSVFVYAFVKVAVILVIWTGFLLVEGVILQTYVDLLSDSPEKQLMIRKFNDGFLFTTAGSDILVQVDASATRSGVLSSLGLSIVNVIIILLTTIYIAMKSPAILGTIFGLNGAAEDLITSGLFLGASVFTFGSSLIGLSKRANSGGKDPSVSNTIKSVE